MVSSKDGKSSAMIRRRKNKFSKLDKENARSSCPVSPRESDDEQDVDEEKEGYIFDDEVLGPNIVQKIMASEKTIFLGLLALRTCNSLLIQTHFVPDEYWQSLEVAHKIAFDYGYMTWEWHKGIRSYLYPTVFAVLFKLLAFIGLDNRLLLIKVPRLVQGLIAACGDWYLYKLSCKLTDRATAQWTLLCQILSWFTLYCCTRTLSNCVETVLVTAALYYFPWPSINTSPKSFTKFIALASFSVLIRPTAAVIWVLMCSWHLQNNMEIRFKILKQYFLVGSVCFLISTILDSAYHGEWIIVHYNFLEFNVVHGGGSIYGTHPWHWYITQGYPVVMGTLLVPFVFGACKANNKVLLFLILWIIFCYSFLSHKEFRFLLPALPLSMHYCGVCFHYLCKKPLLKKSKGGKKIHVDTPSTGSLCSSSESLTSSGNNSSHETNQSHSTTDLNNCITNVNSSNAESECVKESASSLGKDATENKSVPPLSPVQQQQLKHKNNLKLAKILVIFLLVTNVPLALYFGLIHQRGTVTVMKFLYDESLEKNVDILFLMPCHSTPYYSYLHRNVSMRFLTCEPNLKQEENYVDEADQFYNDPRNWLKAEFVRTQKPLPTHLVYFDVLKQHIQEFLTRNSYKDCGHFFHTHFPEGRVGPAVKVSCR